LAHIAKLFMNGRSQAVRLPSVFQFDCQEVFIRQDPATGDVILSRKPDSWDSFFQKLEELELPTDFLTHDRRLPPQTRDTC